MKKLTRDSRIKFGRTTISFQVKWAIGLAKTAIEQGYTDFVPMVQSLLWQELVRCWKSGEATFFRELAYCVERNGSGLNHVESWLNRRLFRDEYEPNKQTHFEKRSVLASELRAQGWRISERQLTRHMGNIGARFRNSKKSPKR